MDSNMGIWACKFCVLWPQNKEQNKELQFLDNLTGKHLGVKLKHT